MYKHLGMLILCGTLCCTTTREVITAALYYKHWSYSPGERSLYALFNVMCEMGRSAEFNFRFASIFSGGTLYSCVYMWKHLHIKAKLKPKTAKLD